MKHVILSRTASVGDVPLKLPNYHCKLTTKGHKQAQSVREQLARKLGFTWKPDILFSSSESCSSTETSAGIYGAPCDGQTTKRRTVSSLYKYPQQKQQDLLDEMFKDLGCVPLQMYFDIYGGVGQRGYGIMDLAQTSYKQIQQECGEMTTDIAIVGHPVLLSALGYFITRNTLWWYQSLTECETVVLDMSTQEKFHICPELGN